MTPEALALEQRIRDAGALVEKHQNAGKALLAREAFQEVKRLVEQRTPETIREMEESRGLRHA